MTGRLAALLLVAQAPAPFDLNRFFEQSATLDGRWVEFDAYVVLMHRPGSAPTLAALTGEVQTFEDGRRAHMCADNPEASIAVLLGPNGFGPLGRRAARTPNAYVGVRIRGILRGRAYGFSVGNAEHEFIGSVDHARIVRVHGDRCLITFPGAN